MTRKPRALGGPAPACTGAAPHCHQDMGTLGWMLAPKHFLQCHGSCSLPLGSNATESASLRVLLHPTTFIPKASHSIQVPEFIGKVQRSREVKRSE